jgi:two-component system sensor histidine kinase DesK
MTSRSPFTSHWWALCFSLSGFVALVDPIQRHASSTEIALTGVGIATFIGLYIWLLMAWRQEKSGLWQTLAIAALGAILYPFNAAAWVFFVVASAFAACVAAGNIRTTVLMVGGIMATALLVNVLVGLPWSRLGPIIGFGIPTAVMCTLTLRKSATIRELTRHYERERMARDMHDVLGHTLSTIILKADLAARVAHHDPDRAVAELSDVDRIARETLDEVRETLQGNRLRSLGRELEIARHTLAIAGVAPTVEADVPRFDAAQENALCLALREGVTNVVRHAQAKSCRIAVTHGEGSCSLTIEDDGAGDLSRPRAAGPGGAGLQGMHDRIAARGGTVSREAGRGTRLFITLPLSVSGSREQQVPDLP